MVDSLSLHPMKEVRVVVSGEQRGLITDLLDRIEASGYTVIAITAGKGHGGLQESHFMFGGIESLEMIMTVVPEEKVEPILSGLRTIFSHHSGVMFVSDVAVTRREYFGKTTS
ncbi:MAG: P-II family nitrogen regulator [Candidatus Melainabacteria bacterium]|nr:P-II family nitrogen regulator [Candidatus Melainabacteria bacterium]